MIRDGLQTKNEAIHSFLMIGQSNMAGRGEFGDVSAIDNDSCFMIRMGRWQKMSEPINPDRSIFGGNWHSGISLAASFADEAAVRLNWKVGLIPCADGGTRIDQWMPGEVLYDHALFMAKLAMRSSVFSGILWHQGESDCHTDETLYAHKSKFITMITALRKDLQAEHVPLLIGELSENISDRWNVAARPSIMNRQYHEIAEQLPICGVVSADELTLKSDGIHFDSASLRVFGKRYFEAYSRLLCQP